MSILFQFKHQVKLAHITWAGGLKRRILTEVVSTGQEQWGLNTRPRSRFPSTDRLSSMFIIMIKKNQNNWYFAWKQGWTEFNSSKVFSSSLFFFFISFMALAEINIVRWKQSMILHFSLQPFSLQYNAGLDASLDGKI